MDLQRQEDWYTHPKLEQLIAQLTTLQYTEAKRPANKYHAEIAVVLGGDTPFHMAAGATNLSDLITQPLRHVLPIIGAPMDVLILPDLLKDNLPPYKLFIFLDPPAVTPEQRQGLHQVFKQHKATVYFHGLPGINDGQCLDVKNVAALTGIDLNLITKRPFNNGGRIATARYNASEHTLLANVDPAHTLGTYRSSAAAHIADPDATVLA